MPHPQTPTPQIRNFVLDFPDFSWKAPTQEVMDDVLRCLGKKDACLWPKQSIINSSPLVVPKPLKTV